MEERMVKRRSLFATLTQGVLLIASLALLASLGLLVVLERSGYRHTDGAYCHDSLALQIGAVATIFSLATLFAWLGTRRNTAKARANTDALLRFFANADTAAADIDPEDMAFVEFEQITRAAMTMVAARDQTRQALEASEQRFRTLVEVNRFAIMELDTQGHIRYANPAASQILGYPREQLTGMRVSDLLPADEAETLQADLARFVAEQPEPTTYLNHNRTGDGRWIDVQIDWNYLRDASGAVIGFVSISNDVTAYQLSQRLLDGRNAVLEMLARGAPLADMLRAIVDYSQGILRDAWISIHLLDPERAVLHSAISRRLPKSYLDAVEGVPIGPNVGSCGHAAHSGVRTITTDIRTDRKWDGYRDLVLQLGLLACWSEPIRGREGQILGTFAIYLEQTGAPERHHLQLIQSAAELAGIVIEHQQDAAARRTAEREIQHLAFHDSLTNLPNRALFRETLRHALARFQRQGRGFALHMLDLDHFKDINDSLGHPVGDRLLCAVAERMRGLLRASDMLARLGGDEFALLQEDIQSREDANLLATKIIDALQQDFRIDQHRLRINTSIGILLAERDDTNVDEMIGRADAALYQAKAAGRGTLAFFAADLAARIEQERDILNALAEALGQERICFAYQPQFSLHDQRLVGVEALMRWEHPTRGLLAPGDFFDIASKRGLLRELSNTAIEQACWQARAWSDAGLVFGRIAVNLCAQQLNHPQLLPETRRLLDTTGADPRQLSFELSESLLGQADEPVLRALRALADLGFEFAIDDFGTGFSSLRHLNDLPVTKLKLDSSLIQHLPEQRDATEIIKAAIALGKALNFVILAEGVETQAQADFLCEHGCDQAQGFLFSHPESAERITRDWLRA
jgi:diguanylate cyclase (GGDEF)-like protein/PAS domain S-box-containing protein